MRLFVVPLSLSCPIPDPEVLIVYSRSDIEPLFKN